MDLKLEPYYLKQIVKDFYIITGVRSSIYDGNFNKILSYPEEHTKFCEIMHNNPETKAKCANSNLQAFKVCNNTKRIHIYKCHAGLTEVIAPLKDNNIVIGYIILGQLTSEPNKKVLAESISELCQSYNLSIGSFKDLTKDIKYKSIDSLHAMAHLLEACTYYIRHKRIISLNNDTFVTELNHYIENHLDDKSIIQNMCREFGMSRTKLYQKVNESLNTSIGKYILTKKISIAKKLLTETDLPIADIAEESGFNQYNYFCSVFKKEVGTTANQYRNSNKT